jgi:cobalt-precorrin-5B (C1)-methyltransferase
VLSTGRTSELVAQGLPVAGRGLPEEAFVMMGDHVGHALRACRAKGVTAVILAGQFAKLLKIACGHEQTHVSSSELDLRTLLEWVQRETRDASLETIARNAHTAREVLEASGYDPMLVSLVCDRARECAKYLVPRVSLKVLLAGYHGEVLYFA